MTKIPDFTALGPVAEPQPANAVARYDPSAPFQAQQQLGSALVKSTGEIQDLIDKSVVQDAYANKFSPVVNDIAQDYYSKQGKDAVDGLGPAQQQINSTYNNVKDDMTGRQAEMFAGLAQGRMQAESYRMSVHSGQQLDKYNELATSAMGTDLVNRAQSGSFLNDPDGAANAVNAFKNTIAQAPSMAGMPPAFVTEKQNEFERHFNMANSKAAVNYVTALPTDQQIQALQPAVDRHAGTPVTNADDAIKFVMYKQEGGGTLVPNDSGYGPSKFGILGSKNGLDATTTAGLTDEHAAQIYKAQYWDKAGIDNLPDNMKLPAFDTVVNFGLDGGGKLIQEAGNDPQKLLQLRQQKYDELVSDDPGRYGPAQAGWQTRQNNLAQAMARGTGQPTGTLLDAIKPPEIMTLYRNAETQQKLDQAAQGEALKQRQEAQVNNYMTKMNPNLPPEQRVNINDVWNDNIITPQQKESLINMQHTVVERGAQTDPQVFNNLLQRVHAPVDDPGQLSNPDDLIPMVGNGISYEDEQRLAKILSDKGTPDADQKKLFFETAHKQLSDSNLMANDAAGERQYYNWYSQASAAIDQKTKSGVPLHDLLTPGTKDYIGMPVPRTPQQQIQDKVDSLRATAAQQAALPPDQQRKPGESIDSWLARTGK